MMMKKMTMKMTSTRMKRTMKSDTSTANMLSYNQAAIFKGVFK